MSTREAEVDELLRQFQQDCEAVVVYGEERTGDLQRARAITRNAIRQRILAGPPNEVWGYARIAEVLGDERRETERMRRAVIATCQGCLAAAIGEPLHTVAQSGYEARTLEGDSWERGWQFVAESAVFQAHVRQFHAPPPPAEASRGK